MHVCIGVWVYVYICMHACRYVCMYVCVVTCMYVHVNVCVCNYVYVHVHVHAHVPVPVPMACGCGFGCACASAGAGARACMCAHGCMYGRKVCPYRPIAFKDVYMGQNGLLLGIYRCCSRLESRTHILESRKVGGFILRMYMGGGPQRNKMTTWLQ